MDADQLLQSLGVTLGLPHLRFDGNGCARLAVDGAPALNFERDGGTGIHIYSVLCTIPAHDRENVYAQLLRANLFGAQTAGAALALDEQHGEIVLCRTIDGETATAQSFSFQVEAFIGAAEDWQRRLDGGASAADRTVIGMPSELMGQFMRP